MDIKLQYETKRSDVFSATRFYFSNTGRAWRVGSAVVFVLVGLLGLTLPGSRWLGVFLLLNAAFQLALPRVNAYFMVRRYFSNPALGRNVQMQITEGGIGVRTEVSASSHGWNLFKSWMESPDAFLLIVYKCQFVMLPKRGFEREEDVAVLREFLRQRIGTAPA